MDEGGRNICPPFLFKCRCYVDKESIKRYAAVDGAPGIAPDTYSDGQSVVFGPTIQGSS
jgi:hypothetical protein